MAGHRHPPQRRTFLITDIASPCDKNDVDDVDDDELLNDDALHRFIFLSL